MRLYLTKSDVNRLFRKMIYNHLCPVLVLQIADFRDSDYFVSHHRLSFDDVHSVEKGKGWGWVGVRI